MAEEASMRVRLLLWSREVGTRYSYMFEGFVIVFVFVFAIVFVIVIWLVRSTYLLALIRYSEVFEGGRGLLSTIAIIVILYFFAHRTPDPMNKNILYLLAGFLWICAFIIGFFMLISACRQR